MEITFWNFKTKLLLVQNWQWHLKTNNKTMNKQWWMPMKDIKTINPAVVLTQTKNNTSCFGGNDYISIATVIGERKMEWWCENYWVLMGWPVFHFTVTVKKKKKKKMCLENVKKISTFHQMPEEPKSMFRWNTILWPAFLFFWKLS